MNELTNNMHRAKRKMQKNVECCLFASTIETTCCVVPVVGTAASLSGTVSVIIQIAGLSIIGIGALSAALFFFVRFGGISFLRKGNLITNIRNNLSSNLFKTLFKTFLVAAHFIIGVIFTLVSILHFLINTPFLIIMFAAFGFTGLVGGSCLIPSCACCVQTRNKYINNKQEYYRNFNEYYKGIT